VDRQAVFKKVSKILVPIEIIFVITSTIFAGVIFYSAFNEYVNSHEVNLNLFFYNLAIYLSLFAVMSIIIAVILCTQSNALKKVKKIIVYSISIFMALILSILFMFTIFQYNFFPLIFFSSAIITILCKFLALIPNGIRVKVKQVLLEFKKLN
jgi:hypothetical protein